MTLRVGLIGNPIGHSLSPAFHNAAIAHLGLDAHYELWEVTAHELLTTVQRLRSDPLCLGANVTIPYKEACMSMVDVLTPQAQRVGALNTLFKEDGVLVGDNTDLYGIEVTLRDYLGLHGLDSAVVLGAGGAAKAVVDVLAGFGCRLLYIINRSLERAQALARRLGPKVQATAHPWHALPEILARGGIGLLVNATPLGRSGERVVPPHLLAGVGAVFDLVYFDTPLVSDARMHRVPCVNGLPMLVHQGAKSFELWFHTRAPVGVMMEAARKAVARVTS